MLLILLILVCCFNFDIRLLLSLMLLFNKMMLYYLKGITTVEINYNNKKNASSGKFKKIGRSHHVFVGIVSFIDVIIVSLVVHIRAGHSLEDGAINVIDIDIIDTNETGGTKASLETSGHGEIR